MTGHSFTIHVDEDAAVVSRSDGSARPLSGAEVASASLIAGAGAAAYSYAEPSAVARASLAEAHEVRPVPTAALVEHSSAFVTDGVELPLGALARPQPMPFGDVLAARRSRRAFAPLDIGDLATVLVSVARVADWVNADDGFQMTRQPVPSAGGRHPCELVVVVHEVTGVNQGIWWFDPVRCVLVAQPSDDRVRPALAAAAAAASLDRDAPATIFVVGHLLRTLSRYPAGTALVWRDAGAMLATLQLAATASGLASCIAGTSGVLSLDRAKLIADLGALVLGRP